MPNLDSHHRFSKRWHVADVKYIAGDDQTTLMVHRNSANLACTFRIYVCLRLCDRDCCSAADYSGSCHAPAPSYFEEMTRCRRQILHWRWPGNPNDRSNFRNLGLFTFTRSQLTLRRQLRGWWRLSEIAQTADVKNGRRQNIVGDDQDRSKFRKFMPTISSKASRKTSFCCYELRRDWRHCAPFTFLLSLVTAFAFTFRNIISQRPPTPMEKPRYTYCRVFL